jgi:phage tail-like protein
VSYPDLTLKWGMTDSRELYDLHMNAVRGEIKRVSGSVIQLDDTGNEKRRWNFFKAWPSKWDGPAFSAKGNDVSIETLTLTCERIEQA